MKKLLVKRWHLHARTLAKTVLIMKLTAIVLMVTCLHVYARGYSQEAKVTLDLMNVSLKSVLKTIEHKTPYKFVYSNNFFPTAKTVSARFQDTRVSLVLSAILEKTGFTFKRMDDDLIVITTLENEKNADIVVKGRVMDAAGMPLAGITVSVENTTTQTATDNNGYFSINAPESGTLVLTGIGYKTERVSIDNKSEITVVMNATAQGLDEVVVIGYGERKKKDVTGALSTVSSKDIARSTAMTPELALQGNATGVFVESGGGEPGARPTVRIRGVNTFGYAEPLYVIDGVPIYEGGSGVTDGAVGDVRSPINVFSKFNPSDIESITVLKDASASAIYGVRASNGVILITTKRGKTGKPRVEFSGSYITQNIPKTIPVLNTQQYMGLMKEMYEARPDAGVSFSERFGPWYDESNNQYVGNGATYDWVDELKNKNAPIKDYNVRASGGTENFNYYFSAGYQKTESPLKGNHLERYSVATNIESKISKYIQTGLTIRMIQQRGLNNTQGDLGTMMSTIPFQPIYNIMLLYKLNPSVV